MGKANSKTLIVVESKVLAAAEMRKKPGLRVDGRPGDIIIPIMGTTGVGKSTFVNLCAGETVMKTSDELSSCTQEVAYHAIELPSNFAHPKLRGRRLVLVDTPGFQDTFMDAGDTLEEISTWLAHSYSKATTVAGIVLLADLAQTRMTGPSLLDLKVFEQLCGPDAFSRVVLGEVRWEHLSEETCRKREKAYADGFWKGMLDEGARTLRIENNRKAAWSAVELILNRVADRLGQGIAGLEEALQIEKDVVDLNQSLAHTEAAKKLYSELLDRAEEFQARALRAASIDRRKELENEAASLRAQAQKVQPPRKSLKLRFKQFFS